MIRRIPDFFIKELISNSNIVNIINTKINLKKQGSNFFSHCPFHNEKSPSFTVSDQKQFYYCFGCGAHGNIIDFLMQYEKLNFVESIEELAYIQGINIPYLDNTSKYKKIFLYRQHIYKLMLKINNLYTYILNKNIGRKAISYLSYRGINKNISQYFSIGYAPTISDYITKYFQYSTNDLTLLKNIGILILHKNGKYYDRFRERIIFPIRNKHGYVIAFGARVLTNNSYPKYLNSPDSNIFHKSHQLYGLYEANKINKNAIFPQLLVVEGYIDVISLTQFGIYYAVSSLGTSISDYQITKLYRYTNQLIFCYDGDEAGRKAAWRSMQNTLRYLTDEKTIKFIFLPPGEDPDSFIRKIGPQDFISYINNAYSLSNFLFDELTSKVNLKTDEGKIQLSNITLPLINIIPGKIWRVYLRKKLYRIIGILEETYIEKHLNKKTTKNSLIFQKNFIQKNNFLILLCLIIQYPYLANLVHNIDTIRIFNSPYILLFIELIEICQSQKYSSTAQIIEFYRGHKFSKKISILACWNHMIPEKLIQKIFIDYLQYLNNLKLKNNQEELIIRDRTHGLTIQERHTLWSLNQLLFKTHKKNK